MFMRMILSFGICLASFCVKATACAGSKAGMMPSCLAQSWNASCAECHSTDVRKGYRADADAYETTWSEVSVGCEACHGPGSRHLAWADRNSRESQAAADRGLVVALVDEGEVTLKRLRRRGNSIALEPANTAYEVRILPPNRVRIQGKMIGLFRKY